MNTKRVLKLQIKQGEILMFDSRVQLLNDYAENYVEKGKDFLKEKGFWGNLLGLYNKSENSYDLNILSPEEISFQNLEAEGFAKFCKIGDVIVYLRTNDGVSELVITENEKIWDCSDWGTGYSLRTRFIAECYFMVTKDDFKIDESEAKVISALIGFIEPSHQEVLDSRNFVYWTLVEKVIEDDVVTNEELETMHKIRSALELSESNVDELHREALLDYYNAFKESAEENEIDLTKLTQIKTMAERLGISEDIFD